MDGADVETTDGPFEVKRWEDIDGRSGEGRLPEEIREPGTAGLGGSEGSPAIGNKVGNLAAGDGEELTTWTSGVLVQLKVMS